MPFQARLSFIPSYLVLFYLVSYVVCYLVRLISDSNYLLVKREKCYFMRLILAHIRIDRLFIGS